MKDSFSESQTFKTGVRWNPTNYKEINQTPYLEYLDKNEEKTRKMQKEQR